MTDVGESTPGRMDMAVLAMLSDRRAIVIRIGVGTGWHLSDELVRDRRTYEEKGGSYCTCSVATSWERVVDLE